MTAYKVVRRFVKEDNTHVSDVKLFTSKEMATLFIDNTAKEMIHFPKIKTVIILKENK